MGQLPPSVPFVIVEILLGQFSFSHFLIHKKMTSDSLTTPPQRVASSAPQESIFDGCTAAAHVAYANSDAAFIFPITPS